MSEPVSHQPVLLKEVIEFLALRPGYCVVDATLGGGGHARSMLQAIGPTGKLYAFDQDTAVLEKTRQELRAYNNIIFINSNFKLLKEELEARQINKVDAVLFDLGVSSYQLDDPQRGFSWKTDCPLDMRMDRRSKLNATDVLNNYNLEELVRIFKDFGEERYSRKIAQRVVTRRSAQKLINSRQLCDIVFGAVPGSYQNKLSAVARIFQAVRIEVNQELAVLAQALRDAVSLLAAGGRLAVISFHSLEDRIVKNTFKALKTELKILTKKPVISSTEEIASNIRSRSAKLRAGEKNGC